MAYFTGRDVDVAITTEHAALGIEINSSDNAEVAGKVGNLLATGDLIKNREWPEDISDFDSVAITNGLTNVAVSAITEDHDSLEFTLTISGVPTPGQTIAVTNAAGTTITLTAHVSQTSGTNFYHGGSNATVTDTLQTAFEAQSGLGFTLTQPSSTTLKFAATQTAESGIVLTGTDKNTLADVVGLDITLGATNEDVSYFGQRTNLSAEIKKETTVAITRKKSTNDFSVLFEEARGGVNTFTTSAQTIQSIDDTTGTNGVTANLTAINNHTYEPEQNYGYRVHLQLKSGVEVLSLKNMCFQEYAVSINADGITEETMTFYSNVAPAIGASATTTVTAETDL